MSCIVERDVEEQDVKKARFPTKDVEKLDDQEHYAQRRDSKAVNQPYWHPQDAHGTEHHTQDLGAQELVVHELAAQELVVHELAAQELDILEPNVHVRDTQDLDDGAQVVDNRPRRDFPNRDRHTHDKGPKQTESANSGFKQRHGDMRIQRLTRKRIKRERRTKERLARERLDRDGLVLLRLMGEQLEDLELVLQQLIAEDQLVENLLVQERLAKEWHYRVCHAPQRLSRHWPARMRVYREQLNECTGKKRPQVDTQQQHTGKREANAGQW
eukprot:scpid47224/ scgid21222/ 